MKKRLSLLLVIALMLSLFTTTVFASKQNMAVDGKNKTMETEAKNGRTYIASSSLKDFGLQVNQSSNNVTLKNKEVTIQFTLNTNKVKVNNTTFTLDSKSFKKGTEAYLPFRFIFETLNYKVGWNNTTNKITLTKEKTPTYPVVFNNEGVNYKITKEPSTIVSLAPDVTETLFAIGAGSKIKGRTKYCDYPQEVSKIKEVGTLYEPSIETVIDIYPELVLAATHYKEDVLNKFKEAKINIFAKDSPKTLEQMYEFTLVLGNIVNRNYEARALVSSLRSKVQSVEMWTSKIKNKPSVYYVVGTGEHGEYTFGDNTFTNDVIAAAGAINVAKDSEGYKYTLEKLIDKNPTYIFGPQWAYDTMKGNDNYKSLKALNNNNFKVVDDNIFSRPSSRLIDQGLKLLVKELHKNIYNKLDF